MGLGIGTRELRLISSIVVSLGLVVVFIFTAIVNFYYRDTTISTHTEVSAYAQPQIKSIRKEISILKKHIDELKTIPSINPTIPLDNRGQEISKILKSIEALEERVSKLFIIINNDPIKAVSLPLIKKDIELLQHAQNKDYATLQNEISRISEMNRWLFGIMLTLSVGVLGLLGTNIWIAKKERDEIRTE